jgi:hypothetical protein
VRAALAETGFAFPHNRRITVSLAPADLPKEWLLQTECRLCKQSAHFARAAGPYARWISSILYPSGSSMKAITVALCFIGPGGRMMFTPASARSAQTE